MIKTGKPQIWLVTELFYPEETSTAYILTELAISLSDRFQVNIICGPLSYQTSNLKASDNLFNTNINISRVKSLNLDKNNLLLRTIRLILLSLQLTWRSFCKIKKGDHVLIVTNPAPLLIFMSLLSKLRRINFNIIVHDVFPENLVAAGMLKPSNFIYKILIRIFNWSYAQAQYLLVLGRDMKIKLQDKTAGFSRIPSIHIVTNWADNENIHPDSRDNNFLLQKLNLREKIVFQFAGNLGRVQGLMELVQIIGAVKNNDIHFLFIGEGALKADLESYQKEQMIKNITILDSFPRNQQKMFLNACDIGIVSLNPNMEGLGVPSKSYNIMAAGKPILYFGSSSSEIGYTVLTEDIGWCLSLNDHVAVINFLEQIRVYNYRHIIAEMGKRARGLADGKFSKRSVLNLFKNSLFSPY